MKKTWDAIVVGSGLTGGFAAKELCERGLRVLMLEAGRPIDPAKDSVEHVPPHQLPFRGLGSQREMAATQPIQSKADSYSEWNARFWVNDRENPYTHPADKPFEFLRGRQVGGRSILWGRKCYRWSERDFTANARDGIAIPWPLGYDELAPWYDRVEAFIGISGTRDGIAQLPDGDYLPPMAMSCGEERLRARVADRFGTKRHVIIARTAVLTREHKGRAACHYCGPCDRGCATRSYFSTPNATLPAALATGKLELRTHAVVRELRLDAKNGRVKSVAVRDARTGREEELRARVIFLCASTIESTRILLNSRDTRHPDGLANSSGMLGRNLMDHVTGAKAYGFLPDLDGVADPGRRPTGIYVPRFRNLDDAKPAAFLRGYGMQGDSRKVDLGWLFLRPASGLRPPGAPGFGAGFKDALKTSGRWEIVLSAFGECLPNPENRVEIDPSVKDAWGIPAARVRMSFGENERALHADAVAACSEMLELAGAKDVGVDDEIAPPGHAIHEMGTARMGADPKLSVLDRFNRAHDVPNLFVTDGSAMVSSGSVNPSLTYLALTARAAHHAADLLARKEL